ncbi:unnamed protein product [Camellia sinensis]
MEDSRNHKKKQAIDGEEEEEDRISSLPDSILHEILSSMDDLKSAVQTSALSKRWRYVWTSLPNLHVDFDEFPFPDSDSNEANRLRFLHFVNQFLSLRDDDSNLCKFYFLAKYCDDPSFITNCIHYAIHHNVQEFHLWAACVAEPFEFPPCFFNSESLKSLKLVYFYKSVPIDKPLCFQGLKTLHLSCFLDDSANFVTESVGNCPNLETLILDYLQLRCFKITAPKLRKLELCYHERCISDSYESVIVVSAPRLTSFKLKGKVSPVFSTMGLPSMDDLCVDLRFPSDANIEQTVPVNVINMLAQLGEANSLTLSLGTLEVLAMDTDSLKSHPSPFHKLKHLKLIAKEFLEEDTSPTLTLPLNVITYLTRGSSCGDTLFMKFSRIIARRHRRFLGNLARSLQPEQCESSKYIFGTWALVVLVYVLAFEFVLHG